MKTINNKIPTDKAQKELKQFAILGLVFSSVALFAVAFLGIVGAACSLRAVVLSSHEGNKSNPKRTQYKVMAIVGLVIGIFDVIMAFSH